MCRGLLIVERGFSSGGAGPVFLCGMWAPLGPGSKPVSPALRGGLLAPGPPGKPTTLNCTPQLPKCATGGGVPADPAPSLWLCASYVLPFPCLSFPICKTGPDDGSLQSGLGILWFAGTGSLVAALWPCDCHHPGTAPTVSRAALIPCCSPIKNQSLLPLPWKGRGLLTQCSQQNALGVMSHAFPGRRGSLGTSSLHPEASMLGGNPGSPISSHPRLELA